MTGVRYLTLLEVIELHRLLVERTGGARELRDLAALEAAVAQPRATFDGNDLYQFLPEKAAALGFALVMSHPFMDGNKRIGHAAIELFLILNGFELTSSIDEAEQFFLSLAAGKKTRDDLVEWVERHYG